MVSILGNLIPFFPAPYLLFVVGLSATFPSYGVIQIATISALGAAIGKFASYGLGYGARQTLSKYQARFDSFRKIMGGSAFLVAFIFAASPFPDDIIFIPLGIIRYSPLKTFIALYSGKFVLTAFVVFAARSSQSALEDVLGGGVVVSIVSAVVVILLALVLMRIDWEKRLTERQNGLLRRFLRRLKATIRGPKPAQEGSASADVPTASAGT